MRFVNTFDFWFCLEKNYGPLKTKEARQMFSCSRSDIVTYSVSVSIDSTDVTLVMIHIEDLTDVTPAIEDTDESYQVMKVIKWWKLSSDESCQVMKVINWWKLSLEESYVVKKVI